MRGRFPGWSGPSRWQLRCAARRLRPTGVFGRRKGGHRLAVARQPAAVAARHDQQVRRFARRRSARRDAVLRPPAEPRRHGRLRDLPQDRPAVPGRYSARRRGREPMPAAPCRWPASPGARGSSGTAVATACGRRRWRRSRIRSSMPATAPPMPASWPGISSERYERIFGPLPPLDGLPDNAGPFGTAGRAGRLGGDERGAAQCRRIRCSPISARRSPPSSAR